MLAAANSDVIAATSTETPSEVVGDLDAFDAEVVEAPELEPEPLFETLDVAAPEAAPPALEEDSFLCPRFTEGDLGAKPAGALLKKAFHAIWGGSSHIIMPPIVVDTKAGQASKRKRSVPP